MIKISNMETIKRLLGIDEEEAEKEKKKEEVKEEVKEVKEEKAVKEEKKEEKEEVREEPVSEHIIIAKTRFLNTFPELSGYIDKIDSVARSLLIQDYQKKNIRTNDYFDYLVQAWNLIRTTVLNSAKKLERIPAVEKKEVPYTYEDFKEDYIKYLQDIKFPDQIIEVINLEGGVEKRELKQGKFSPKAITVEIKE